MKTTLKQCLGHLCLRAQFVALSLVVLASLTFEQFVWGLDSAPSSVAANSAPQSNSPKQFYSLQERIDGAKESFYTQRIHQVLKTWPPKYIPEMSDSPNPIWVRGIRTPDKPNYIGLVKRVIIKAPLEKIAAQIETFEKYREIFEEVVSIEVTFREGNRVWTKWERDSPAFFIANPKYQQVYVMDTRLPNKKIYRYQLVSGNSVNNSDGIIVLERLGNTTRLTAWDFFDADWGLARTLAEGLIWRRALETSYIGDAAFLTKAEHPDWDIKKIVETSKKLLETYPLDSIQYVDNFMAENK